MALSLCPCRSIDEVGRLDKPESMICDTIHNVCRRKWIYVCGECQIMFYDSFSVRPTWEYTMFHRVPSWVCHNVCKIDQCNSYYGIAMHEITDIISVFSLISWVNILAECDCIGHSVSQRAYNFLCLYEINELFV